MIGKEHSALAESRFYVLMALSCGEKSKVEVLDYVYNHTCGRVNIWPGMLCTILDQFEEDGLARGGAINSYGLVYELTDRGHRAYGAALQRLCAYVGDAVRSAASTASSAERAAV